MTGLRVRDIEHRRERDLPFTGLFLAIGHDPRSELFTGQLDSTTRATSRSRRPTTATNLPGVFACGDVVDHTYRQAITAAGTGCAAALDAERCIAAQAETGHDAGPEAPAPARAARPSRASRPAR